MKKSIAVLTAVIMLFSCAVIFGACSKDTGETTVAQDTAAAQDEQTTQNTADTGAKSLLNGLPVENANARPVGIVVENTPAARPQWGITTPALTFEYEVEGGITRMLWVYDSIDDVPEKVGPVRSARHDAVELAMGMDMLFVHIGKSTIADELMNSLVGNFDHIDGNYDSSFHYKDTSRNTASEHRSVLTGSLLREDVAKQGIRTTTTEAPFFVFGERELAGTPCENLYVSFSNSYAYDFEYDESKDAYTAEIDGEKRADDDGNVCEYDNVIILYVDTVSLGDSSGHQDLLLENGGVGLYVNGGIAEGISWSKPGTSSRLTLSTAYGSELVLNPGTTYIGFVRSTNSGRTEIG